VGSRHPRHEDRYDDGSRVVFHISGKPLTRCLDHPNGHPDAAGGRIVEVAAAAKRDRHDYSQYESNHCKYRPPDPFYEPPKVNDENVMSSRKQRSRRDR